MTEEIPVEETNISLYKQQKFRCRQQMGVFLTSLQGISDMLKWQGLPCCLTKNLFECTTILPQLLEKLISYQVIQKLLMGFLNGSILYMHWFINEGEPRWSFNIIDMDSMDFFYFHSTHCLRKSCYIFYSHRDHFYYMICWQL